MTTLAYRPEIDGLRAIAVAGVVLYHLDPNLLPGGFAGVDVFFVISGYLITSLLLAEWRASGRIDLADFYARRVRRLMPALWLVITTVMLASAFLLGHLGEPFHRILDGVQASLLFLANLHFLGTSGDYFAGPSEEQPLLHLWSLAVEEQFYLVFPLLLGGLLLRGLGSARKGLWLLSVLSLLLAEHWLSVLPPHAFFHMPSRFWELAAGVLVALSARPASPGEQYRALTLAGLAMLAVALLFSGWRGHFPGVGALPAVLGTTLVLVGVHRGADMGIGGRLLAARPVVALGLCSYALYLWHWPLLALDRAIRLSPSPLAWRATLCLLALLLAALTYRYVEQPVRRGMKLAPRTILLGGLAGTVLLLASAHALGQLSLVPVDREALVAQTQRDRPADIATCHYGIGSNVTGLVPDSCELPPMAAPGLAIWGDSHALAWRPFAEQLADGKAVLPVTMDACSPLAGATAPHRKSPGHAAQCDRHNELAMALLSNPEEFETVLVVGHWTDHAGTPEARSLLESRLGLALDRLASVPQVIVLAPVHELAHPAPKCIAAGRLAECAVPRAEFEAVAGPLRDVLRRLAATRPNVTVVDPSGFFCGPDECPVLRDGYALFWDDDHVSSTAARSFAQAYLAEPTRYTLTPLPPDP